MAVQGTLERQELDEYYRLVQELINRAASLGHRLDLEHRIEDKTATKRDWRMLRRKYHSNLNDLDHEIRQRGNQYMATLEKVLIKAQELGLELEIEDINDYGANLFGLLVDPTRRGKYRTLARYYKKREKIVSLETLENIFQYLPKPA